MPPKLGHRREARGSPCTARGGRRGAPIPLPPWGPWGPACSWGSPAGPSTALPTLLSPESRVPRQAPRQAPAAWLSPLSTQVSPVPLSPASPRRGAKAAPREDKAETMTHPGRGESGCAGQPALETTCQLRLRPQPCPQPCPQPTAPGTPARNSLVAAGACDGEEEKLLAWGHGGCWCSQPRLAQAGAGGGAEPGAGAAGCWS